MNKTITINTVDFVDLCDKLCEIKSKYAFLLSLPQIHNDDAVTGKTFFQSELEKDFDNLIDSLPDC